MSHTIAIDGPAGAGKSTVARNIAKDLGFMYVDTGAMYRAMALYMLQQDVDLSHPDEIAKASAGADITIEYEGSNPCVYLNGKNVNDAIRTEEVSDAASRVSAVHAVRERLTKKQQAVMDSIPAVAEMLETLRDKVIMLQYQFMHNSRQVWLIDRLIEKQKTLFQEYHSVQRMIKAKQEERKALSMPPIY